MNCKPGDLAITVDVHGHPVGLRNSGRLVEVLDFAGSYRYAQGHVGVNTWRVRLLGSAMHGASNRVYTDIVFIDDKNLRPIRPGDVTDEEVRELFAPKQPETV